ncbi:MAG: nucleotide exchange factor GrpE [Acidobacteria bacterium]|nr:nucleotide exchange factor GrpE [Acidobacteriota bacterium]
MTDQRNAEAMIPEDHPGLAGEEKLGQLEEALQKAADRELRLLADFENYRRRTSAHMAEERLEEKKKLVLDLLDVLDSFRLSLEHLPPDTDSFISAGVQAIYRQLQDVLRAHGVERIDPAGETFDPAAHEVLDVVEDADTPPLSVTRVYKYGYTLNDRLIRPALVQVVKDE